MTNANRPAPTFNYPTDFFRLYDLADGVTKLNLLDEIDSGFARLHAVLSMTTGEAGEAFRGHNATIQDSYLDGCGLLATEIHQLFKQLEATACHGGKTDDGNAEVDCCDDKQEAGNNRVAIEIGDVTVIARLCKTCKEDALYNQSLALFIARKVIDKSARKIAANETHKEHPF